MNLKILGSGGWNGIPAPFCDCRVCMEAGMQAGKDARTRPEILVESEKGRFLIEISPDIRMQLSRSGIHYCEDFLVSHWHFDHLYGLYELHEWAETKNLNLYCSAKTGGRIGAQFGYIRKNVEELRPFIKFSLKGVGITPFPVYHMRAEDEKIDEKDLSNTFGFLLDDGISKTAYLSDYYRLGAKAAELATGVDLLIADGTYLFEHDLVTRYPHLKNDTDHLHGKSVIDFVKTLKPKRVIFHSITHLSNMKHSGLQSMLPKNMQISFDGMAVNL